MRSSQDFDRQQIREWVASVEDDLAEFVGSEFEIARIIGNISQQHAMGNLDDNTASQLLKDATHIQLLLEIGRKFTKLAKNPLPEMRLLVLEQEARERRQEGQLYT
jgi:hypothetical protein